MKTLKCLMLVLMFFGFSYAYPNISLRLKSSKSVMPSIYELDMEISYTAQDSSSAIEYLSRLDSIVRGLHIPYKGGNFSVFKNCFYSNNKYVCQGYKGIENYSFYMKSPKDQDEIFNALKGINYEVTRSFFIVPQKNIEATKKYLIEDLAKKSITYASRFSKIFNASCFVKSISYMENIPRPVAFTIKASAPLPAISKETISMYASLNISCR